MSRAAEVPVGPEAAASRPRARAARAVFGRPCRLIFVNRYFFPDLSATSQMLTDLVRSLAQDPFEIHIICSRQLYDDSHARLAARDRFATAQVHRCWSASFGRGRLGGRALDYLSFLASSSLRLLQLAREGDIIVAMTDPPLLSVPAASVARWRRARLVNWLQDLFPEVAIALAAVPLPRWMAALLLKLRDGSLRAADKNIVLSAPMHRFVTRLPIAAAKQQLIENWADGALLTPRPSQWSQLRRTVASEARFVIQYSGNMGRAHEYQTLLGAALELRDEAHWLFLFVGGGANMQLLQEQVRRHKLRSVRFLPYQPRESLADSLAAADVHVSCLRPELEGLIVPSKLYGILAAGRPVIVIGDPDGEQARIVRGAGSGSIIARGDSAALVNELRRMRSEPEWMRDAGLKARYLFEDRYTLATAARKWRATLEKLAGSCAASAMPGR